MRTPVGESQHHNIYELPAGLPVPVDDGACNHLPGLAMPSVSLRSNKGRYVNVSKVSSGKAIFFFFPGAGRPGVPSPRGWNEIPGARGCTPQICSFRDANDGIREMGFQLFGASAQRYEDLVEIGERNRVPYELISDAELKLARELNLPTFEVESSAQLFPRVCIKRLTLVVESGTITKVFYPVFPPDRNADEILAYLRAGTKREK